MWAFNRFFKSLIYHLLAYSLTHLLTTPIYMLAGVLAPARNKNITKFKINLKKKCKVADNEP